MLPGMAGANLSDDVALQATAICGLFRAMVASGTLGRGDLVDLPAMAAAAGISEAQARMFISGRVVLPPRQAVTFVAGVLERMRAVDSARAEALAGGGPPGAEATAEGVEAAGAALRRQYPDWQVSLPAGYEGLGGEEAVRLVWTARRPGRPDLAAVSAAELGGKMRLAEADMADTARKRKAWMEG